MKVGGLVHFLETAAGVEYVFYAGEVYVVDENNSDMLEGCMRAGLCEEVEIVPEEEMESAIDNHELIEVKIINGEPKFMRRVIEKKIDVSKRQRILIFCPTTKRVKSKTIDAILAQEGELYYDLMFTRDNPHAASHREVYKNIQLAYEKMRLTVLNRGYDKVWVVEEDMIPPKDALKKLLAINAPVVSGLYALRHSASFNPNVFRLGGHPQAIGSGFDWKDLKSVWGESINVSGCCMGCLLIDRSVMDSGFSFILDSNRAPDIPFAQHCWSKGILQVARLDVVCGHINTNDEVLMPDRERGCIIERKAV